MHELIKFPSPRLFIPTPICAQPGDEFDVMELDNDSFESFGLHVGAVTIIKRGERIYDRLIHAVSTKDGMDLGVISAISPTKIHFQSYSPAFRTGEYAPDALPVYGCLVEIYPTGLRGARLIVWHEDLMRHLTASLSHVAQTVNA